MNSSKNSPETNPTLDPAIDERFMKRRQMQHSILKKMLGEIESLPNQEAVLHPDDKMNFLSFEHEESNMGDS